MEKERLKNMVVGSWSWKRLARSILEVYLCLVVWAWLFADRLIFRPPPETYEQDAAISRIPVTPDERIAVLSCPVPGAQQVVLYCHGNAETVASVRFLMEAYQRRGFSAYTFDYRGYGLSDGKPGVRRAYADGEAALNHLVEEAGIDPGRIILHGRSVGAAVALHLANRYPVGGLVVESGFVTAFRVVTRLPVSPLDRMRNNRAIRRIDCPVLVIHGREDETIPFWHGQKLYDLAPEPKTAYWVEQAGHNNLVDVAGSRYWDLIESWSQTL